MRLLKTKLNLEDIIESIYDPASNLAKDIDSEDSMRIAQSVIEGFEHDKMTRSKWDNITAKAMELVELERKIKNTPYENAANTKYPMVITASMHYAAMTGPEIIRNGRVAAMRVIGSDYNGDKISAAKRVENYMSWQLLVQTNDFEKNLDDQLSIQSIIGTVFKKTYYDPMKGRNCSDLCLPDEVYISNNEKCIEDARRITHRMNVHRNTVIENMRAGLYVKLEDNELDAIFTSTHDKDNRVDILEQHAYLDLDGDGYEEPYIITVIPSEHKLLRIVPRFDPEGVQYNADDEVQMIDPAHYFTDYHFIPSPDGTFYSWGFGHLMYDISTTVNSLLNQLIDAGTLATMQGGILGRNIRIPGGTLKMGPGMWTRVESGGVQKLSDQIYPINYKDPSNVLLTLMGSLIEAGKELSSINDVMRGQEHTQNSPVATVMTLLQQGKKVQLATLKRFRWSLKKELEKMFRLNRLYADPKEYIAVLDDPEANFQADFDNTLFDIYPVGDPEMSSQSQRLYQAQLMYESALSPIPGAEVDGYEIMKRFYEAANVTDIDSILRPVDKNAPPPPEQQLTLAKIEEINANVQLKAQNELNHTRDVDIREYLAEGKKEQDRGQAAKYEAESLKAVVEAMLAAQEMNIKQLLAQALDPINQKVDGLAEGAKTSKPAAEESAANELTEEMGDESTGISGLDGIDADPGIDGGPEGGIV